MATVDRDFMNCLRAAQSLHECGRKDHAFSASKPQVMPCDNLPGTFVPDCLRMGMHRPGLPAGRDVIAACGCALTMTVF
ncbi:hypothetical protein ABC383_22325 [Noviherbaspirillum sp. 1P10PC]|uniref:hypothetical protein n=1 Tax=Noviherbaspirillum sp. 1P10PC TaxID=3132292 RepID=UPI0039A30D85